MPAAAVPVEPDAGQARRWAEEELAKAVYDATPGPVERLLDWLRGVLEDLWRLGGQAPPDLVPVLLVVGFVLVLLLARLLGGRVLRRRRVVPPEGAALFEDDRGSVDLVAAADAAARRGDFATAVLERFRALVRALDERGVLEDRPGLTAHEATVLAAAALPGLAADLNGAGELFDAVRYGHLAAGPGEDAALRELTDRARHVRPGAAAAVEQQWAGLR